MAELQTVSGGNYEEPYDRPYNRETHMRSSRPYTRDDYMKDSLLFNSNKVEVTQDSIDPDTGKLRQPWYRKHSNTLGKIFLVIFFSCSGIYLILWELCSLCGQSLHLLPVGSVQSQNTTAEPVCLDGSPAGYYMEMGDDPTRWVIWLAGGGVCPNLKECQFRAKGGLGTSKVWPKRRKAGTHGDEILGMGEDDNPGFHHWSKIYIPYCSGDAWLGHQHGEYDPWGKNKGVGGMHFAGHTILAAVVQELKKEPLRIDTAKQVMLSGTSHGGYAALMHVDWLQQQLPGVDVRGNPQAGWFGAPIEDWLAHFQRTTDSDPTRFHLTSWIFDLENHFVPPQVTECLKATAKKDTPALPEGFAAYFPGVKERGSLTACITAPVVYNYTKARVFVSENTEDMYQVLIQDRGDGSDHHYSEYVRQHIAGSLTMSIIDTPAKKNDGLFAPACKAHCLQYDNAIVSAVDNWYSMSIQGDDAPTVSGYTHAQAISGWIKDDKGKGSKTQGGPWKLLSNVSKSKPIEKCETKSGPLLAVCLVPVLPRSLIADGPQ